jgi:hypothetical protein
MRDGANYTGLELSASFIDVAKKKLNKYPQPYKILEGDMRHFNLNVKFDLIFIGFNSFLHLLTDEDVNCFFSSVKKHMHSETKFIIDIFTPNPLFLYRPENVKFPVLEYVDSLTKKNVEVEESNKYNIDTEINNLTWYFYNQNKELLATERFTMRMYFPSKMNQLLIDNGFNILNQWGDYYRSPLNEASKLQIYHVML